ncbi:hypothetical protein BGZ63DRAFT_80429 [Mariannaea sp. PMI_226]|nr:hypothetical protein BGZ63DRAFT_80429 [Mariannaea sp. PMI_226]
MPRKDDNWQVVTEPVERRRIQNRMAQRRFRQKAKETAKRTGIDMVNYRNAQNSYRIHGGVEIPDEAEVSGLPWGSISIRHIIQKGIEAERQGQQSLWAPIPELYYDWKLLKILTESTNPGHDITTPLSIAPDMLTLHNLNQLRDAAHSKPEETICTPSRESASGNACSI